MNFKFAWLNNLVEGNYLYDDLYELLWRADNARQLADKIFNTDDVLTLTFNANEAMAIANAAVRVELKRFMEKRRDIMNSNLSYRELEHLGYVTEYTFKAYKNDIDLKIIENELLRKIEYNDFRTAFRK